MANYSPDYKPVFVPSLELSFDEETSK